MVIPYKELLKHYTQEVLSKGDCPFTHIPDFNNVSKDIEIFPVQRLSLEDIYVDDDGSNQSRTHGTESDHIGDLVESHSAGIDVTLPLAAVVKVDNGFGGTPYRLAWGYHRYFTYMRLGIEEYFFYIIKANPVELALIQLVENETVIPKLPNKEEDIINTFVRLVKSEVIANDEDAIRDRLLKTFPLRKKLSRDRIAESIFARVQTKLKFASYTSPKVKKWLQQSVDSKLRPAIDGNYDDRNDMYGFVTSQGDLYRTFYRALVKFSETGKRSYVTSHVKGLASGHTIDQQRMQVVDEYTTVRSHYAKALGKDLNFLTLNGFLPQSVYAEPWYKVVTVNQDMIEAEVKSKIVTGLPDILAES